MPTLTDLVESECGQSNALVALANKIFPASETQRKLPQRPTTRSQTRNEDFVTEFLHDYSSRTAAPSTFDMGSLLKTMRGVGTLYSSANLAHDWINEFVKEKQPSVAQSRTLENAWALAGTSTEKHSAEKSNDQFKWSVEYLQDAEQQLKLNDHDFETAFQPDNLAESENESQWVGEFAEFLVQKMQENSTQNQDEASNMEEAWGDSESLTQWIQEYTTNLSQNGESNEIYHFAENNPYSKMQNTLQCGKEAMKIGDLSNAVLFFEAAVLQEPNNADAWQHLGQAQAENEYETKAIAALNSCLKLEPGNLDALIALATAYTNESMYQAASETLVTWLRANPKYSASSTHSLGMRKNVGATAAFLDDNAFHDVEKMFLDTLKHQQFATIDPELQNALGVLYNMSGEMDKAADCFKTALSVEPENARLWNRLGATLANDHKSAEAISAYRKALELYPAFVRARYNLGVSCHNLASFDQACEHFISALTLQQNGLGPKGGDKKGGTMSQTIWSTLRQACSSLQRENKADLLKFVDNRNFEGIKRMFNETL